MTFPTKTAITLSSLLALSACGNNNPSESLEEAGYTPEYSQKITCYDKDGKIEFTESISEFSFSEGHQDGTFTIKTTPMDSTNPEYRSDISACLAFESYVTETDLQNDQPYTLTAELNGSVLFEGNFSSIDRYYGTHITARNVTADGTTINATTVIGMKYKALTK